MKLLLDESIPRKLSASFPDSYFVRTVAEMGWRGTKNGKLLKLAADQQFHALITADRGIEHQQNLNSLPLHIIILVSFRTRLDELLPLVPKVITLLESDPEMGVHQVTASVARQQ